MIFTVENTKGKKATVYDQTGLELNAAVKYNTRTREVTLLLTGISANGKRRVVTKPVKRSSTYPREVIKVKVKIPGSFIVVDGKKF